MRVLTEDAKLICSHALGIVQLHMRQDFVTIAKRRVLVDDDPENRAIKGCPYTGAQVKPCTTSLRVQAGYSDFVRVDGQRICLDTVRGLTDGNPPPRFFEYSVKEPGQDFVSQR